MSARRRRSHLTEADCLEVFREFAGKVSRMMETSDPEPFERHAPDGTIVVTFQVRGSFGVGDPMFDAIRVLNGCMLPAKGKKS